MDKIVIELKERSVEDQLTYWRDKWMEQFTKNIDQTTKIKELEGDLQIAKLQVEAKHTCITSKQEELLETKLALAEEDISVYKMMLKDYHSNAKVMVEENRRLRLSELSHAQGYKMLQDENEALREKLK